LQIADRVKLVLEPTRTISGHIDLAGLPPGRVSVLCRPTDQPPNGRFLMVAPVKPDGSFTIAGVPARAVRIGVYVVELTGIAGGLEFTTYPASPRSLEGLQLTAARPSRIVDVIVRSPVATPIDGAQVFVLPGKIDHLATVDDVIRFPG